jgi:hypothetical protein
VVSNQNHFISFHVLVLTTVPDHSQVVSSRRNDDSRINVAQLGTSIENTRLACTLGTNKTNQFHFCQGVQVPVQTGTLSPQHLRPSLSAVLRPPPNNPPLTVGPERVGTHDKRVTSLPAPISKHVLRIISI